MLKQSSASEVSQYNIHVIWCSHVIFLKPQVQSGLLFVGMPPPAQNFAAPTLQPPTNKLRPPPKNLPPRAGKKPKSLYQAQFAKIPSKTSVGKWGVAAK